MDLVTIGMIGFGLWRLAQRQLGASPSTTPSSFGSTVPTIIAPAVDGSQLAVVPVFPSQAYIPTPRPVVTLPPSQNAGGFKLSDQMVAKMSERAIKEVLKWFDTPVQNSATMSPEAQAAWSEYKQGEWADYSEWTHEQMPAVEAQDFAFESNAEAFDIAVDPEAGLAAEAGTQAAAEAGVEATTTVAADTAITLSECLTALAVVGVLVDIGFTIASNKPDALKAIDIAIDAAIIVCLFIPVYGWIIAIVLVVVKLIIDLFGSGGGESHQVREMKELNKVLKQAAGMAGELAETLSPRELVHVLWQWTTGYCGGMKSVAIITILYNRPSSEYEYLTIARNPCYTNTGRYREWPNTGAMSLDDQALALVTYADQDFEVLIQAGVNPNFLSGPDWSLTEGVKKKCVAWRDLMAQGITLDQMDALAAEHRKQPRLQQIATFFGAETWYDLVGWHLQDYWTRYLIHSRHGSLADFAKQCGYPAWIALRDDVAEQYGAIMDQLETLVDQVFHWGVDPIYNTTMLRTPFTDIGLMSADVALEYRLSQLNTWISTLETACASMNAAEARRVEQQTTMIQL